MRQEMMLGASVADVVLPSFDENGGPFADGAPGDTIAHYRGVGTRTVLVKNGAAPLSGYATEGGAFQCEPVAVEIVVDSTAAGDSFAVGFMAALEQGHAVAEAAQAAMALAVRVIQAPGALVSEAFEIGE